MPTYKTPFNLLVFSDYNTDITNHLTQKEKVITDK